MILEMKTMCNFDENMLCDYLTEKGYRAHYEKDDALSGWILKELDLYDYNPHNIRRYLHHRQNLQPKCLEWMVTASP